MAKFHGIVTNNNNVIIKDGKTYLLNQKEVGTNLKDAKAALSKLEKKQNNEIKRTGFISTY